jgi:hypothetical protein
LRRRTSRRQPGDPGAEAAQPVAEQHAALVQAADEAQLAARARARGVDHHAGQARCRAGARVELARSVEPRELEHDLEREHHRGVERLEGRQRGELHGRRRGDFGRLHGDGPGRVHGIRRLPLAARAEEQPTAAAQGDEQGDPGVRAAAHARGSTACEERAGGAA